MPVRPGSPVYVRMFPSFLLFPTMKREEGSYRSVPYRAPGKSILTVYKLFLFHLCIGLAKRKGSEEKTNNLRCMAGERST